MCQTPNIPFARPPQAEPLLEPLIGAPAAPATPLPPASDTGSRRRRLWDLDSHAHCPVVGVCLPIAQLRRLVARHASALPAADDYELHCIAVNECKRRSPLADSVQKELDQRFALALRQSAQAKTTDDLAAWWREASAGQGQGPGHSLAAAFWATLTHARCDEVLTQKVLGEVHMLQHQVGMATRVELARFEALIDENAVLARELGAAQERTSRLAAEQQRRIEQLEAEAVRLRGELLARDMRLAQQQERMQALTAAAPDLAPRHALAQDNQRLGEALRDARRELQRLRLAAEAPPALRAESPATPTTAEAPAACEPAARSAPVIPILADRAVLCVGGRSASVPAYRQLIERTGGRFLHHDGGTEDSPARLDATLAAADLVICQTGCVSHDAYWRVKDHCRRTGKRCLFVDTPSRSALARALAAAAADATRVDEAALPPQAR